MVQILGKGKILGVSYKDAAHTALVAIGAAVGGPAGASAGEAIFQGANSSIEGKREHQRAQNAQNDQAAYTKKTQDEMNRKLAFQQSKLNQQLASGNRNRVRGGLFGGGTGSLGSGQQSTTGANNPTLG